MIRSFSLRIRSATASTRGSLVPAPAPDADCVEREELDREDPAVRAPEAPDPEARDPDARLPPRAEPEDDRFAVPDRDALVFELDPPRLACGIECSFRSICVR